jgi:hypothetical protein
MGTSSTRYQINAFDSAGQARTLIITEYLVTHQGDAPDDITPMLDRATCETEDGQTLIRTGAGEFFLFPGKKFTTDDPRVLRVPYFPNQNPRP